MLEPCDVVKHLGHFDGIVPSLVCILDVFWRNNMASAVEIPIGNPWKWHFRDSKNFQDVPRCLSPKKLAPSVLVPKLPTIHYQPASWKLFDSPGFEPIRNGEKFWMSNNVIETRVWNEVISPCHRDIGGASTTSPFLMFHRMTVLLSSSLNDSEIFSVPVIPGGYPINTNIIQYEKGIPKTLGILVREYPKWGKETTVIVHFLYREHERGALAHALFNFQFQFCGSW